MADECTHRVMVMPLRGVGCTIWYGPAAGLLLERGYKRTIWLSIKDGVIERNERPFSIWRRLLETIAPSSGAVRRSGALPLLDTW